MAAVCWVDATYGRYEWCAIFPSYLSKSITTLDHMHQDSILVHRLPMGSAARQRRQLPRPVTACVALCL